VREIIFTDRHHNVNRSIGDDTRWDFLPKSLNRINGNWIASQYHLNKPPTHLRSNTVFGDPYAVEEIKIGMNRRPS
jgi:hypothetical protein